MWGIPAHTMLLKGNAQSMTCMLSKINWSTHMENERFEGISDTVLIYASSMGDCILSEVSKVKPLPYYRSPISLKFCWWWYRFGTNVKGLYASLQVRGSLYPLRTSTRVQKGKENDKIYCVSQWRNNKFISTELLTSQHLFVMRTRMA